MRKLDKNISAHTIAILCKGDILGDEQHLVSHISDLTSISHDSLSFALPNHEKKIKTESKGIILISKQSLLSPLISATLIRVQNPQEAFLEVCAHYIKNVTPFEGIHQTSQISELVQLDSSVSLGAYSYVSKNVRIGPRSIVSTQVFIGEYVVIGADCYIYPGVKILKDSIVGDRVVIHSNSVIGSDGFGYYKEGNTFKKINHYGRVILEDDVEIGSNCCIDKAPIEATIIRKSAKLDNLVHIAHGVEIGEGVAIAAQCGIAGSAKIGKFSIMGGQVGIAGHISIAPGSQIQGKSGIVSDIKQSNKKWYGYPVLNYFQYLRSYSIFKNLPSIVKRLEDLENRKGID